MKKAINYINETLGTNAIVNPIQNKDLGNLPMYFSQAYKLYDATIFNINIVLVELKNEDDLSILQVDKHLQLLKNTWNKTVVLVLDTILSYNRNRLIEKGINFIVPGKQLFLPELLINLSENYAQPKSKQKSDTLMPSAQLLLLYHIIHRYNKWQIEDHAFNEIADKLNYTPMAITNAVEDLKQHEFIEVHGDKEKYIKFKYERSELWNYAQEHKLVTSPIIKTVYVDVLPSDSFMLKSNASAMPEYTSLNPSRQQYYAIEKNTFYALKRNNRLVNANDQEGQYAIEVWKYNPLTIAEEMNNDLAVVDPLSLYLSLKDSHDERIEMGLEQIIDKVIW
jgi:hypothetical protein